MPGTVRPRPGRRSPLCPHTGRARAGPETQPFLGAPTGPHSHGCQASPLGLSLSFKPLDVCPGSSLHAHDLSPRNSVVCPPHFSLRVPSRRWGLVMLRSISSRVPPLLPSPVLPLLFSPANNVVFYILKKISTCLCDALWLQFFIFPSLPC